MDEEEALTVLGLRGPADAAAVKRAYRRLARRLHPDAGGDAEEFHRVRTAYEVLGDGTTTARGPEPQQRVASVDERWWDGGSAWHEAPVERVGVQLDADVPDGAAVRADLDLLATLLGRAQPVAPIRLRSRAPGSRLHRIIAWLQPDMLAAVTVAPATSGPRPGHDVVARIQSSAGRGRRLLATADTPEGWTRARGSETVRLERRMRPCREPADTAVRVAGVVATALEDLAWPLTDWFLLRV